MEYTKICKQCKTTFNSKYKWQTFCQNKCRNQFAVNKYRKETGSICLCGKKINKNSNQCSKCFQANRSSMNISKMTVKQLKEQTKSPNLYANYIRTYARILYKKYLICFNCQYDKHTEVCHVKPISKFNELALISEINASSNIVILCPNCHWEFDNKLIIVKSIKAMGEI